jgi:hypothetical protein
MNIFRGLWTAIKATGRVMGAAGRATIALVGICGVGIAIANYAVTQGAGTNFGSVVIGGVHYAQQFICDLTTPAQCAAVSAGGAVKVDNSAVTQPASIAIGQVAAGALAAGAGVDGWDLTQGATGDAAVAAGAVGSFSAKFRLMTSQLGTANTNVGAPGATVCATDTGSCSINALFQRLLQGVTTLNTNVTAPPPLNVNTVNTAWTGLTPGASASSQTGTIIAANVDLSSQAGVALGVPGSFGTAPAAGKALSANASLFQGTAIISATNGIYSNLLQGNAVISATNGIFSNALQGNAVLSATNGGFQNILQGNVVLSATNGLYANLMVGNAAVATGTGAQGATVPRVTVSTDQATNAGAALVKGGVGVVNGGSTYQAVAASQTATVLQTSTGATGDYLSHCTIYPTSTSPGVVTVFDNTNAAAGSVILFPGGASSVSNLVPFAVPVGAVSTAGAWKVTTGAAVSVVCYGKFS